MCVIFWFRRIASWYFPYASSSENGAYKLSETFLPLAELEDFGRAAAEHALRSAFPLVYRDELLLLPLLHLVHAVRHLVLVSGELVFVPTT